MPLSVKHLPHKFSDLSLDLETSCKKPDVVVHNSDSSEDKMGGGFRWIPGSSQVG